MPPVSAGHNALAVGLFGSGLNGSVLFGSEPEETLEHPSNMESSSAAMGFPRLILYLEATKPFTDERDKLGQTGTNGDKRLARTSSREHCRFQSFKHVLSSLELEICMNMKLRCVWVVLALLKIERMLRRGVAHRMPIHDRQKNNGTEMIGVGRVPSTLHSITHARRRRGRRLSF